MTEGKRKQFEDRLLQRLKFLKPELASMRRLSEDMAALVHQFQEYRRSSSLEVPEADLNAAVLGTVTQFPGEAPQTTSSIPLCFTYPAAALRKVVPRLPIGFEISIGCREVDNSLI